MIVSYHISMLLTVASLYILCNVNSGMIENSELRTVIVRTIVSIKIQILCVLKLSATYFYSDAVFLYILICAMNIEMI